MFITLEGIEGSGKSTQLPNMVKFLEYRGHDCTITREPGGTKIGQKIRAILLDPESKDMDPLTELLLYTADRAQHIKMIVNPLLAAGKTVLCDRYFDATLGYQGYARGLDVGLINRLHEMLFNNLKPDLTILLDLQPKLGLSRAWKQIGDGTRSGLEIRFEEEELEFHEKVRAGYLEMARIEPERFRVIDGSENEEQVRNKISELLSLFLETKDLTIPDIK